MYTFRFIVGKIIQLSQKVSSVSTQLLRYLERGFEVYKTAVIIDMGVSENRGYLSLGSFL